MKFRLELVFILVLAIFSACRHSETVKDKAPLNILLFTADDLDKHSLGCYGGKVEDLSPNIYKFASEGMMFNHAFVNNSIYRTLPSKTGGTYGPRSGFCLETQHFPNAPNEPNFPTTILKPGETFTSETWFQFSVK